VAPTIVTIGELTVDDVVFENRGCDWKQLGGGALYSAIGARVWGTRPAISSTIGEDYPERWLEVLDASGIDVSGLTRIAAPSLHLWLLYEQGGRRHQVQMEASSTFAELDEARQSWVEIVPDADGIHVAPQTPEGQIRALREAEGRHVLVTLDLLIEPFIDVDAYRTGQALQGANAFLPSDQEVRQIWGRIDYAALLEFANRAGVECVVVKEGSGGVVVATMARTLRIPAIHHDPLDPTGAGDAFCGGFLAGLINTGDHVEAAIRGSVSASFVVETRGALAALEGLSLREAQTRAKELRPRVSELT
jgi:cytidine kinase